MENLKSPRGYFLFSTWASFNSSEVLFDSSEEFFLPHVENKNSPPGDFEISTWKSVFPRHRTVSICSRVEIVVRLLYQGEWLCCFRDSALVTYGGVLPLGLTLSALHFILSARSRQSCKQDCETVDFCNSLYVSCAALIGVGECLVV